MKTLLTTIAAALLVTPALATTYSGRGSWISIQPGSSYAPTDRITWSFTTGDPIPQLGNIASFVTAFSFTIGSQSWTLSDAIGPSINLNGSVNPFFRGINADNTFLFAGISFNGATMIVYPEKHFVVGNIGAGPGPLDQFGQPSANNYLGEYTAIGTIAPPVPEPASWALLIVGFGLTGAALRRRRSAFAA